jgi:preprotein translocase subunit YajC
MELALYRQKKRKKKNPRHFSHTKGQQLVITGGLVFSSTNVTSTADT